ncbi:hypothetical protein [Microbacterium sp. MYb64]|uniref:hypothetical protein n=1 Tax=Microbacterium sp. MYb64 TaxID=1848691 RepID=UPI0011AFDB0B|nr:hypothetical protein [Microbacterium sp. MYb64]
MAIRLHLAVRNKTNAWLASSLHRSPFWVSRRMNSDIAFDANDLDEIAGVFGITVESLLQAATAIEVPGAVAS